MNNCKKFVERAKTRLYQIQEADRETDEYMRKHDCPWPVPYDFHDAVMEDDYIAESYAENFWKTQTEF